MKGRIKNIWKRIIKYPVTIWMVLSIIVLVSVYMVYAAYNGTADIKRVVSTQASSTSVFSSNYLEVYSATDLSVKNLRTTTEGNFIVSITVCNYDQLDPTSPAKALIEYSLTAELVEYNSATNSYVPVSTVQTNNGAAKTFYVQKTMDNNATIDIDVQHSLNAEGSFTYTYQSESLTGGVSYKDTFDICFDAAEVAMDVPELFIRVTATPTTESQQTNSGISTLQSIISISQGRSVETGWHGSLQETNRNQDYDGYNLVIEGSGSGTIDIEWDNTKFAMNPVFVALYGSTGEDILGAEEDVTGQTGKKKRTLTVNSINSNRYVVQFYKRDEDTSYTGSEFPSKYIECKNYIAAEENEPENEP